MAKTWYTKAKTDELLDLKADLSDAVGLAGSGQLPVSAGATPFQGTSNFAARSDHRHQARAATQYPVGMTHGTNLSYSFPIGPIQSFAIGNVAAPLTPFPVPRPFTLTEIVFLLHTAADAGNYSLAIYASNTVGLPEGAPVWSSTGASATSTGTKTHSGINLALTGDKYWLGFGSYGFTTTRARPGCAYNGTNPYADSLCPMFSFSATDLPGLRTAGWSDTTGAWPTLASNVNHSGSGNANCNWTYGVKGTLL